MKQRVFFAGISTAILGLFIIAGQSVASDSANLIVYELSNPLLDDNAQAPGVQVSTTGQVAIFRPPGYKSPGSHSYVLSDTALSLLTSDIVTLNTGQVPLGSLVADAASQDTPTVESVESVGERVVTTHQTDPTVATIELMQITQTGSQQTLAADTAASVPSTTLQIAQAAGPVALSDDSQGSDSQLEALRQTMAFLYRLPMTQPDNSKEVDFER